MFLLDTNVLSELRKIKIKKADQRVVDFIDSVDAAELCISAITIFEIEMGILKIAKQRSDEAAMLSEWMSHDILPFFGSRILTLDHKSARIFAHLMHPRTRAYRDAMIAATAMAHGCTIVTRNIRDFQDLSLPLIDPWLPR